MNTRNVLLGACAVVATIAAAVITAICADEMCKSIDQARGYPVSGPRSIP